MRAGVRVLIAAGIIHLLVATDTYAWWSVPGLGRMESTHAKLGMKMLSAINPNSASPEYPDIARFGNFTDNQTFIGGIVPWMSGGTDDENAHGQRYRLEDAPLNPATNEKWKAGDLNGGPIQSWWGTSLDHPHDGVLVRYKEFEFAGREDYTAYYYMALMAHLVTDQAVPAHAANILHVSPIWDFPFNPTGWGDNLENAAYYSTLASNYTVTNISSDAPLDYYWGTDKTGLLDVTKSHLQTWTTIPSGTTRYWYGPANHEYLGAAWDIDFGHYDSGVDIYGHTSVRL